MIVRADFRPLSAEELTCRKRVLRDAVICIGWLKLLSVIPYILLFLFTYANSKGDVALAIQIMTLAIIPFQVCTGILLFLGALEEKPLALAIAFWLSLLLATYNSVLGIMGCFFFIRSGQLTLHFILAVCYALLLVSIITVICHDLIIIFAYKQLLETQQRESRRDTSAVSPQSTVTWDNQSQAESKC